MEKQILETIKEYKLIENGDKIIVGVSGGPDSICMLDLLRKIKEKNILKFEIIVVHINHKIREEADLDEEYVINYCKKNNLKIYTKRANILEIAKTIKTGTEEAGRKVRYNFFEEILEKEKATKIATAHNKNDKIETIIMNILRGSGIGGSKGIEAKRDGKYIRPLIETEREKIEKYCMENNLNPRIDKTNFTNDYTRNKIRNIVIPYIKKEFNSNIIETLNRFSKLINEEDEFLKRIVEQKYREIKISSNSETIILDLKKFNIEDIVIRKRLIIYAITKTIGNAQNIEKINIDDIIKMCEKNVGNKYLTPNKNIKIMVNKGKIFFQKLLQI